MLATRGLGRGSGSGLLATWGVGTGAAVADEVVVESAIAVRRRQQAARAELTSFRLRLTLHTVHARGVLVPTVPAEVQPVEVSEAGTAQIAGFGARLVLGRVEAVGLVVPAQVEMFAAPPIEVVEPEPEIVEIPETVPEPEPEPAEVAGQAAILAMGLRMRFGQVQARGVRNLSDEELAVILLWTT